MAKNRLIVEFDYDFDLFGIISTAREYRIAWEINQKLNINLTKQKDIELKFLKDQKLVLSNYLFESLHNQYWLIRNRSNDENPVNSVYLLPELQKFDYFIMIKGKNDEKKTIISKLKEISLFNFVSFFNVTELKSKENLIF
jgi:hypothetical protein